MKQDFKKNPYPKEDLTGGDWPSDNGTMPKNVKAFEEKIVGRRIVKVEKNVEDDDWWGKKTIFTLDNGKRVSLMEENDCCAYTAIEEVILTNLAEVEHAVLGVGTTNGFKTWHIYCNLGDIMQLKVGWSSGNPFYYSYGFTIAVEDV